MNIHKMSLAKIEKLPLLDTGAFAAVYSRRRDKFVVKVTGGDPGGEKYITWVHKTKAWKTNPAFPRTIQLRKMKSGTMVVKMEKLQGLRAEYIQNWDREDLENYIEGKARNRKVPAWFKDEHARKALADIRRMNKTWRARGDLHTENIMRRGEQLVITDPLAIMTQY